MSKFQIMKKSIVKKSKLNKGLTVSKEFQAGFNDCIVDCMIHLMDIENLNINDPILQELFLYLIQKRNSNMAK